jgi:hypothetical protein
VDNYPPPSLYASRVAHSSYAESLSAGIPTVGTLYIQDVIVSEEAIPAQSSIRRVNFHSFSVVTCGVKLESFKKTSIGFKVRLTDYLDGLGH